MTDEQSIDELTEILNGVIDRWCPTKDEPFGVRSSRALFNLHAFEEDYKACLEGREPIRTDYPLPLPPIAR